MTLILHKIDPSWEALCQLALSKMDPHYLNKLAATHDWLPGPSALFNAFNLPLSQCRFILLGESPYPRPQSANGFAFWDAAVNSLWGTQGFSPKVNRATSLRNFLKMLLVASGDLHPDQTQARHIALLKPSHYISTAQVLFERLLSKGFLLLNASLVLGPPNLNFHTKHWFIFLKTLLGELVNQGHSHIKLILMGQLAKKIQTLHAANHFPHLVCEHPYNLSFITNPEVIDFFKPFQLLSK